MGLSLTMACGGHALSRLSPVPVGHGDILFSVPLSGGSPTTIVALDNQQVVNGFATDGSYLYFSTTMGIEVVPLVPDGGTGAIFTISPPGLSGTFSGAANLIGAYGSQLIVVYPQGEVDVHMPAGSGGSVSVDDECVYWSNSKGIFSLAKTVNGPFDQ